MCYAFIAQVWSARELDELKFANHQMVFFSREFIGHIPSEMTFLFLLQLFRNSDFVVFFCGKKVRGDDNNNTRHE